MAHATIGHKATRNQRKFQYRKQLLTITGLVKTQKWWLMQLSQHSLVYQILDRPNFVVIVFPQTKKMLQYMIAFVYI